MGADQIRRQGRVLAVCMALLLCCLGRVPVEAFQETGGRTGAEEPEPSLRPYDGFLYFSGPDRLSLTAEPILLSPGKQAQDLGRQIIHALIKGPSNPELRRLWPENTRLLAFYIADRGQAYVDLDLPEIIMADTRQELLAIYSLVNSLTLNIPPIKQVKILVRGQDAATLAGHMDLATFYQTNMLIVK